ncbi:MAG: MlaD family protein [Spirochaetes bacterium]|jgi:phospholipid/cholesterol/gamma-HCH transport system substrate-binding protein|nr:MlaD family protein [Spirochaetota bacterium]
MRYDIAVGIFFFVAVSVLGYFTIIMSEEIFSPYEYYTITAVFPDIEGLGENDKIKVNGVLAGLVSQIKLQENSVLVTFRMFEKFTLFENYRIKIKNETSLGGKYVSIYPGCKEKNGKYYQVVENRINLKGESTGDALGMLSDLIAENKGNVYSTINNVKEITEKLNSGQGTLGKLINEDKIHQETDGLVKEVRDSMEDSREQAPVSSFIRALLIAF